MAKYEFLICDGNGAASRGTEVDNYFEFKCEAVNDEEAYKKLTENEINGYDSLFDWFCDYEGYEDDEESIEEAKEAFEDFSFEQYWDDMDVSGGDPFVVGIKINGEFELEPDIEEVLHYGANLDDIDDMNWFEN